jgi:hypothetical protein
MISLLSVILIALLVVTAILLLRIKEESRLTNMNLAAVIKLLGGTPGDDTLLTKGTEREIKICSFCKGKNRKGDVACIHSRVVLQ